MKTPLTLTPWQKHVEAWKNCKKCFLWKTRSSVVLGRGALPCDVLFVGEAPGESENALGLPFQGPAGRLLDSIILRADLGCGGKLVGRLAVTNLIACIPYEVDSDGVPSKSDDGPEDRCVQSCAPRLQEFVRMASPGVIVTVGGLARDWLDRKHHHHVPVPATKRHGPHETPTVHITHPAAMLRMPTAQRGFEVQRAVVIVANAVLALHEGKLTKPPPPPKAPPLIVRPDGKPLNTAPDYDEDIPF